ncbi:MAG: class I tRNA ligase family protein, partial [Buchnera aphidicola]|nr:class I tRNA ligase family protein [Buchnera aphidicola]
DLNYEESTISIQKILKKNIKKKIHYQLKDWCISRQRYWGTPIPMAILKNKKIIPIPNNKLPVLLDDNNTSIKNNINIKINETDAIKEKDTFDTFIESSWYYARYTCPHFKEGMINPQLSKYWLPVDQYVGGIEHATMHLIYIRFFHKLLRDFKLVSFDEPVKKLLCQGMVLSQAFYYLQKNGKRHWVQPSSV